MAADTATRPSSETGAWDAPSANVAGGAGSRKPAAILAVAAFAAFLATFNETFLNVGFAPIMADLAVDVSTVQWLATAYMLGAAVMVPVSAFAYRSFPTPPLVLRHGRAARRRLDHRRCRTELRRAARRPHCAGARHGHAHSHRYEHHPGDRTSREAGHLYGHHGRHDHARGPRPR